MAKRRSVSPVQGSGNLLRSISSDNLFRGLEIPFLGLPKPKNEEMENSVLPGLLGLRKIRGHDLFKRDDSSSDKKTSHVRYGKIKVTLLKGLVYREKVEAVVNTTSGSLDLKSGLSSRALVEAAGEELQNECKRKYPDGIKHGEVAETGGFNLECGYIFHGFLKPWGNHRHENQAAEQVLADVVQLCLEKADQYKVTSIAFPALGTGGLGLPAKIVARTMLQSVKDFEKNHKSSTLKDVRFVIFPRDTKLFKDFDAEMSRFSYTLIYKPLTPFNLPVSKTPTSCASVTVGKVKIEVIKGSLTDQKVDVIVNSTNKKLQLDIGALSKSILNAAGEEIQKECNMLYPDGVEFGQVAFTKSYNLSNVKMIYHVCTPQFNESSKEEKEEHLYLLIQDCLLTLTEQGMNSIAFPTLGSGFSGFPPENIAHTFFPAVVEVCTNNPSSSLKHISVVVFPGDSNFDNIWKCFIKELEKFGPNPPPVQAGQKPPTVAEEKKVKEPMPSKKVSPPPVLPKPLRRGSRDWLAMKYEEDICIPANWKHYKAREKIKVCKRQQKQDDPAYRLVDVDDKTVTIITDLVQNTWKQEHVGHGADAKGLMALGFTQIAVTKVQRVENLNLFESYSLERQRQFDKARMKGRQPKTLESMVEAKGAIETTVWLRKNKQCSEFLSDIYPEINEHYLFHGTLDANIESVLSQGLDNRLAGDNAMFGAGAYGAESATKSDQYVDERDKRTKGSHRMLLIRMCLGDMCLCDKAIAYKRAPCKKCRKDKCKEHMKDNFDSVVGDGKWLFREFVVYDKRQSYPEYVITYDRI